MTPWPRFIYDGNGNVQLLPDGSILQLPGIPADHCQNVLLNQYLPFDFSFQPGTYTATVSVIECGTDLVLGTATANVVSLPTPAPQSYQNFDFEVQDENGTVLSQSVLQISPATSAQSVTLPQQIVKLGELFNVQVSTQSAPGLVTTAESVTDAVEASHPINSSIFSQVTELFQGKVVVHFPSQSSSSVQSFFPIHSGTVNLHFAVQGIDLILPVQVVNCHAATDNCTAQLGSSPPGSVYTQFDDLLMQYADRSGIPPQLLKAQITRESGFNSNAFRYEPLSIDFAQIAAPNGGTPFGVLQQRAFAPWALATSKNCGIVIQPQGANLDLTSDDATARQKYKLTLGPNGDARCRMRNGLVTVPSRPIAPTDTEPSMDNVFYTNDNPTSNNWSAIASSQTSERFYNYQVDNPPFTSQTVIASSYGLHQLLYQTAVGMGYIDQNRLGLSPGNLFDPATSLDLGTEYLAQMFVLSGGTEQSDYVDRPDFQYQFAPALRAFNAGAGKKKGISVPEAKNNCPSPPPNSKFVYACTILKKTPNYDPVSLPAANSGGGGGGTGPS